MQTKPRRKSGARFVLLLLAGCGFAMLPLASPAESEMFLKLDRIAGEAGDSDFSDWIEVLSLDWGVSQILAFGANGGSRPTGRPDFDDVAVVKWVDKATPLLLRHCSDGSRIADASFIMRQLGQRQEFYRLELTNLMVTAVTIDGHRQDGRPSEKVSLDFAVVEITYYQLNAEGTHMFTNTAVMNVAGTNDVPVSGDADGDGILDDADNCPSVWNPGQTDTDRDGAGDVCDSDDDNDGLTDAEELWLGTDPRDADSVFKLRIRPETNGLARLTWEGNTGNTYAVTSAPFPGGKTTLIAVPIVDNGDGTLSSDVPLDPNRLFYRVRAQP